MYKHKTILDNDNISYFKVDLCMCTFSNVDII
jgi:hypothetical protein